MRRPILLPLTLTLILACQLVPTPPPLRATPRPQPTSTRQPSALTPASPTPPTVATQSGNPTTIPGELAPFPYRSSLPFAEIQPPDWNPSSLADADPVLLPFPLDQVANRAVAAGLTTRQRTLLSQNGFVVLHSQEAQFSALHRRVSLQYGQPYYLTTDAASHALRLALAQLVPVLEREELRRRMLAVTQATLEQVLTYLPLLSGTELEADTRLSAAYLAVAVSLLDPQADIDPELAALVHPQVQQVLTANGPEISRLIPAYQDDFRVYRPTGHYAADPDLRAYFRAMTWLGRASFSFQETQNGAQPSRLPLLVTLALRQASIDSTPATQEWARISETLDFLNGASTVAGPAQFASWMDRVYGPGITIFSLSDASRWKMFLDYARELPFFPSNPAFALLPADARAEQSWSFIGERFNLDDTILRSLAASPVDIAPNLRLQPGGLEVMAVLSSQTASQAIQSQGEINYRTTPAEISRIQAQVGGQTEAQWSGTLHGAWMHAVQAIFAEKSQIEPPLYPAYMRTQAWAYKDLNSALGSWVELRHDSAVAPSQPITSSASLPNVSPAAPAWVEPNPLAFYRLSKLAFLIAEGLKERQMTGVFTSSPDPAGLSSLQVGLIDLADRLQRLGDLAAKELSGASLTADDYALIQAPLGPLEESASPEPALPVIVSALSNLDRVVQAGIGSLDRLYVLVPLDGKVYIAQGGVYSYYEFSLPLFSQLNDRSWRWMLVNDPPESPVWVQQSLYFPEGNPVDVLAFHIGDIFRVILALADEAEQVKIYETSRLDAPVIVALRPGDVITITGGPVIANQHAWWQVQVNPTQPGSVSGWIVESQTAFERVWGE